MPRYRATGADAPWHDSRRAHGVDMEGYFWRVTDAATGRVVAALCGVCRGAGTTWAVLGVAVHPEGVTRTAIVTPATADPDRLGVVAGPLAATPERLRVALDDVALDVAVDAPVPWPGRLGGLGLGHVVPGLGQYWHPWLLGGRARGTLTLGGEVVALDGAEVYAEKNWGNGFPRHWWWGQAHGFARGDACVAFAGGPLRGRLAATALVVRAGETLVRLGDPLRTPVRTQAGAGEWRLRGRGARWAVTVEGDAPLAGAHVLPVPLPRRREAPPGALEHQAGTLRVIVRRGRRTVWADESRLAGLELGGFDVVAAELTRRGAAARSGGDGRLRPAGERAARVLPADRAAVGRPSP